MYNYGFILMSRFRISRPSDKPILIGLFLISRLYKNASFVNFGAENILLRDKTKLKSTLWNVFSAIMLQK